jgi:hypothetical protein
VSIDDAGEHSIVARVDGGFDFADAVWFALHQGPMMRSRSPKVPTLNSHSGRPASI